MSADKTGQKQMKKNSRGKKGGKQSLVFEHNHTLKEGKNLNQDVTAKPEETLATDLKIEDWATSQALFEKQLLNQLYPHYPSTRKLAQRLNVSHNKIAMKLKEHDILK